MEQDEIKDQESLMGWLKVQSRTDAVAIYHRSALRVASIWFAAMDEPWAREGKLTSLPVLRHLLTSGVAAVNPTSEIKAAASAFSISFPLSDSDSTAYASASASAFAASAFAANASFSPSSPGGAVFDLAVTAAERYANASSDFWEQFRKDARCLQHGDDLLSLPLWSIPQPDWFKRADADGRAIWANDDLAVWSFWTRWWDGVLSGKQINWDLQRAIALIPDADWQQGPAHIAAIIARLEEQFDLRAQIAELRANLRAAETQAVSNSASTAHRSHNHPPELVETPVAIRRELTVVYAALDDAEAELAKPNPDNSVLKRAGLAILSAAKAITLYCASLTDTVLKKAAEEVGSTGAKWAIRASVAYYGLQTEPLQFLGKALVDFAKKAWLGG